MTTASKQAFSKPENQLSFWSHKKICLNALKNEPKGLTYREVAAKVRLKPDQCWKRLSELHTEGRIITCGVKEENGNANSIYAINDNPPLFHVKKLTLREFIEKENPALLHKYEALHEHKL